MDLLTAMGLLALASGPADPGAVPLWVEWSAPSGCLDPAALRDDVERLVGRPVVVDPGARDHVVGAIVRQGLRYRLELEVVLRGEVRRRELEADRCETLGHVAGLVVAVAVAPLATARATRLPTRADDPRAVVPVPAWPAAVPSPTAVAPSSATRSRSRADDRRADRRAAADARSPPPPPPPPRRIRHALTLGAAGGLGFSVLPGLAGGLFGSAAWHFGRGSLELYGGHLFGRTASVREDAGVRVQASGAGTRLCLAWEAGPVEVPVCVGALALAMAASGQGPGVDATTVRSLWVGAGPGVGLAWRATAHLGVRAAFDLHIATRRPGFHLVQGLDELPAFRSPPVSLALWIGPYLRFG
ncbi:MAG: hypothetical protein AAGF11_56025 [Myxococcota bacterium]